MGQTGSGGFWFVGMNLSITTLQGYIFCGTGERNRGYALLMMANKPETALYRTPTFSLLLASHGGLVHALYLYIVCGAREKSWIYSTRDS